MEMDEWKVIRSYFQDHMYPFTKHHLDSYREFLRSYIPNTIKTYNPITMIKYDDHDRQILKVDVYVGGRDTNGIYIDRPVMYDSEGKHMLLTPHEARLRNLTYQTNLFADLEVDFTKDDGTLTTKVFPRTMLGAIPIMTHSDPCILHGQGSDVLRELNECIYDQGGYFIIDGKEKVIVSQERITTNRLFISELTDDQNFSHKAMIRCTGTSGESALIPRTVELYVVRNPDTLLEQDVIQDMRDFKGAIFVSLPSINGKIPLKVLFKALGVESDKAMVEHILGDLRGQDIPPQFYGFVRPSIKHTIEGVNTQEEALEYLKPRVFFQSVEQVKGILVSELFPNISGPFDTKARFLGYLVQQLMKVSLGIQPPSDRDSYAFKRVDISGFLLAQLFQETYNKIRKACRDMMDREYYYGPWKNTGVVEDIIRTDNLHRLFQPTIMSETFVRSLKGMWGPKDQDPDQGLVQDLARISYIGFLSHLRRVNLPLDRSIKVTSPHRLHGQQWGVMCPFESPDGASIGYLKNLALLTHITFGTDPSLLKECLQDLEVVPLDQVDVRVCNGKDLVRVFVNGDWFGMTDNPVYVVKMLRLMRRNGLINPFTSVSWDMQGNDIRVQCEPGRPCRPLFVVENGKILGESYKDASWFDMVFGTLLPKTQRNEARYYANVYTPLHTIPEFHGKSEKQVQHMLESTQGCIEFLDIEEENTVYIAMWPKDITAFHTHVEIHPSTVFSVVTNNIPLLNHNFAPRNVFYGSQSKQAIGVYTTNFTKRFDTMGYVQHYPQKPLVTTRNAHFTGNDRMPNGVNVIVAVATYTGFNQEDGLIINKNAIDRGLFQITAYKSMSASEKKVNDNEYYMFGNPVKLRDDGTQVQGIKHANYTLLDDNGFIPQESYIPRGQEAAVLGMIHVRKTMKEKQVGVLTEQVVETSYRDVSEITDVHHYGKIDKVFVVNKGLGNAERICKIRFRKTRRPELGDKGCSRCAQKGVIGMILPAEDMPFTKDGIIPDLIINAHAFPSRMTIAHLVECVFSKLCTLEGVIGDGTVFLPFDKDSVFERLSTKGFEKYGNEMMYNGRTGEMINTEIFLGPTFYLRLKHMVTDKVHARGTGPKVLLTHQPTSGRSKAGGLRIGEMERDVIVGHGMSQFVKESMMEKADKYVWAVCKHCGTLAKYAPKTNLMACQSCKSNQVSVISTPYSFKLLVQELESIGVQMRLSDMPFEFDDDVEFDDEEEVMVGGGGEEPPIIQPPLEKLETVDEDNSILQTYVDKLEKDAEDEAETRDIDSSEEVSELPSEAGEDNVEILDKLKDQRAEDEAEMEAQLEVEEEQLEEEKEECEEAMRQPATVDKKTAQRACSDEALEEMAGGEFVQEVKVVTISDHGVRHEPKHHDEDEDDFLTDA